MANGLSVNVILMDDGVWVARVGQNAGATGWTALSEALANTFRLADGPAPQVLADEDALTRAGLTAEDLVSGVRVASPETVAELVATARHLIIF
jgi:sulfur relay (sulfurtransferase) DsrF/TusC family protein